MEQIKNNISPQNKILREMEMWQKNDCSQFEDYNTLWEMFRTVVTSSSYGTSEFGGPVWLMDFSLANLQKLFPNNPWLEAMQKEWEKGSYGKYFPKSEQLRRFSDWFEYRASHLIEWLGLGNVIVKQETNNYLGNMSLYGWGLFLDVVQSLLGGNVYRPTNESMLRWKFSLRESDAVRRGNFLTKLTNENMRKVFPCFLGRGIQYVKQSNVYGDCYELPHFSLTKGFVIAETIPEKILILVVNDLMECKAQGYGNKADREGNVVPYPKMKFEQYLDCTPQYVCVNHFRPTVDVFSWKRSDGKFEEIKIQLPQINPEYGEFWHRQFPMKQNWRELTE